MLIGNNCNVHHDESKKFTEISHADKINYNFFDDELSNKSMAKGKLRENEKGRTKNNLNFSIWKLQRSNFRSIWIREGFWNENLSFNSYILPCKYFLKVMSEFSVNPSCTLYRNIREEAVFLPFLVRCYGTNHWMVSLWEKKANTSNDHRTMDTSIISFIALHSISLFQFSSNGYEGEKPLEVQKQIIP